MIALQTPRFTVRRMMVAVAVIATAIATEQTRRRWMFYRGMVEFHAKREQSYRVLIPIAESLTKDERFQPTREDGSPAYVCGNLMRGIRESPAQTPYHARQRQRYEHAVWCPWESVLPEPPPP